MELQDEEKSKSEESKKSARINFTSVSELRRKFEEKIICENNSAINGVSSWSITSSTSKISKLQEELKKDSPLYSDKLVKSTKRVSFCLSPEQEKPKPTPAPRNKLTRTTSVPTQIFKVEVKNLQKEIIQPVIVNLNQDENSNLIRKSTNDTEKPSTHIKEDSNLTDINDNFKSIPKKLKVQKNDESYSNLKTEITEEDSIIIIKQESTKSSRKEKKSKHKRDKKVSKKEKNNLAPLAVKEASDPDLQDKSPADIETDKEVTRKKELKPVVFEKSQDFKEKLELRKNTEVFSNEIPVTFDVSTEPNNKDYNSLKKELSKTAVPTESTSKVNPILNRKESNKVQANSNQEGFSVFKEIPKLITKEDLTTQITKDVIDYKDIVFADPEDQHLIVRAESSDDSLNKIESDLDSFIMDNNKVKERKRSNSFRRIFKGGIFGNNKKKEEKEVKKATKKTENAVFADNAQNESFNRTPHNYEQMDPNLEQHYAQMHINRFQQAKANFEKTNDYVCMDNPRFHNNTIQQETSSSSNTLDSENLIYENKNSNLRNKFFETPPRAHETYQNVQLVKPKALIPINSERPLPNPYQDKPGKTIERNLNANSPKETPNKINEIDVIYGTVYDQKDKHNSYASSESTKSLEITKLKLPTNRERVDLQPRLKSPIPQSAVSTDKIIATELLKDKKNLNSPTHQRFDSELDYPRNEGQSQNNQFTTNVLVHVDSPNRSITPTRSITPSTSSLQRTPPKHEIRQSVEAFCWKELKKLKEREDYELQMRIQSTPFGHAEEPIIQHRSRGLSPSLSRNTRRSASLPREVLRQRRQEEMESKKPLPPSNFTRNSPQRNTVGGYQNPNQKPIFRRGSLTQHNFMENQAIYNKKVSFNGTNQQQQPWPTKNGYTQSPPQRRVDLKREISLEDDVFLPNEPGRQLTREEIFMINQQKQKQMLQAQQSNMARRMPDIREVSSNQNRYDYPPSDATYDSFDGQNKKEVTNGQEGIYGSYNSIQQKPPQGPRNLNQENIYGTRNVYRPNENNYVNREPIYGTKNINEPVYGARRANQSNYGTNISNGAIYGSNPTKNYVPQTMSDRSKNMIDPNQAQNNPNYGTRNLNGMNYNGRGMNEPIYGAKIVNGAKMSNESNYGVQKINEVIYNSNEPIYGTKTANEAIYGIRSPNGEPIYGRRLDFSAQQKLNSVNNKVCDIYGKIHDTQDHRVMSPPASQTSGVLYGQLQRNMNVSPMQYQSYNQIHNNSNFVRGSRLTASVNDMYRRYQPDPRHLQRQGQDYEPPNRPLPPIPNDHKTKFGLRRRNIANNDNNECNPRFLPGK